jgi:hypothetical protein
MRRILVDDARKRNSAKRGGSLIQVPLDDILTIHEIGEADGHQFIATEFIEGQTLRERLRSGGRAALRDGGRLLTRVHQESNKRSRESFQCGRVLSMPLSSVELQ